MPNFFDRVKVTVSGTPGTGDIGLGAAASGFRTFASAGAIDGMPISYVVEDGSNWECGHGMYSATSSTITTRVVLANSAGNTNPISVSPSATIYCAALAEDLSVPPLEASAAYVPPPVASNWTLNNPTIDGSSVTRSQLIDINIPRRGLRLQDPFPAYRQGDFAVSALVPVPATHFYFQARLRRHTPINKNTIWGLVLRDSGSGRSCIIGPSLNVQALGIYAFSNDQTFFRLGHFTDTSYTENYQDVHDLWMRIGWNGTNYNLQTSMDGSYWATFGFTDSTFNSAFDAAFQATHIGFGYNANNGINTQQEVDCFSFAAMAG